MIQLLWQKSLLLFVTLGVASSTNITVQVTQYFNLDESNAATLFTILSSQRSFSKVHCASLCSQSSQCLAFHFSSNTSICQMSNEEPGGFGPREPAFTRRLRRQPAFSQCKRVVASNDGRLSCPIQQRVNGDVSFDRTWSSYETGFGDDVNFWIGLQPIHQLTSPSGVTLIVDLVTWTGDQMHQEYSTFYVNGASAKYIMTSDALITNKSNMFRESLDLNNGYKFSTSDQDNDEWDGSCSINYHGNSGWWFGECSSVNPNGIYASSAEIDPKFMTWTFNRTWVAIKAIRLMLVG